MDGEAALDDLRIHINCGQQGLGVDEFHVVHASPPRQQHIAQLTQLDEVVTRRLGQQLGDGEQHFRHDLFMLPDIKCIMRQYQSGCIPRHCRCMLCYAA